MQTITDSKINQNHIVFASLYHHSARSHDCKSLVNLASGIALMVVSFNQCSFNTSILHSHVQFMACFTMRITSCTKRL